MGPALREGTRRSSRIMATPNRSSQSRFASWLRKHFPNPICDRFEGLFAFGEGLTGIKRLLGRITDLVRAVKPKRLRLGHKPKAPLFLPRLEPLETRLMPTTYTWTGYANTDWSNSGNWSPSTSVPGSGDTAIINGGNVRLDAGGVQIDSLELDNGKLDTNGYTLELDGSGSLWTGGTLDGSGTVEVHSGGTLHINTTGTTKNLNVSHFDDYGTVIWTQDDIYASSAVTITVESSAVWKMAGGVNLTTVPVTVPPSVAAFTNNGSLTVGGVASIGTNSLDV